MLTLMGEALQITQYKKTYKLTHLPNKGRRYKNQTQKSTQRAPTSRGDQRCGAEQLNTSCRVWMLARERARRKLARGQHSHNQQNLEGHPQTHSLTNPQTRKRQDADNNLHDFSLWRAAYE